MSDSVQPHKRQPTRLPRPWDSPGKNTGVGCHFLLQCMKMESESEVAQSCSTLSDPMDCSPPGSSAHGIFQARVLEWGAISFSATLGKYILNTYSSYHSMQRVKGKRWLTNSYPYESEILSVMSDSLPFHGLYIQSMDFSRPEYWNG